MSGADYNGQSTAFQITDFAADCSKEAAGAGVQNGQIVFFALAATDASGAASPVTKPGDYLVVDPNDPHAGTAPNAKLSQVFYEKDGMDCRKSSSQIAISGKVTVTAVSAAGIEGTFDVVMDSQTHMGGSFNAPTCASYNPNRTPLTTCN